MNKTIRSANVLETTFIKMLHDSELYVRPYMRENRKWVLVRKGQAIRKTVVNTQEAVSLGFAFGQKHLESLDSYAAAAESYSKDDVFSKATARAGYYGRFDRFVQTLAAESGVIRQNSVVFDEAKAIASIRRWRQIFAASTFDYKCSARLRWVELKVKQIDLSPQVKLVRLTAKELNAREPISSEFRPEEPFEMGHSVEARCEYTIALDESLTVPLFNAASRALGRANEILVQIKSAIALATGNTISFDRIRLEGGFDQGGRHVLFDDRPRLHATLDSRNAEKVKTAFEWLGSISGDATLEAAHRRIVLGHSRWDLVDKIVDYVIACEAILLTNKDGQEAQGELSYQFALNGALLISRATRRRDLPQLRKRMKAAYSARSAIVHGAGHQKLLKAIRQGDFQDLGELAAFLAENLGAAFFWLLKLPVNERPYKRAAGWEEILWAPRASNNRSRSAAP
jgi:hypothetical protein